MKKLVYYLHDLGVGISFHYWWWGEKTNDVKICLYPFNWEFRLPIMLTEGVLYTHIGPIYIEIGLGYYV
jgi:hypothetical protein